MDGGVDIVLAKLAVVDNYALPSGVRDDVKFICTVLPIIDAGISHRESVDEPTAKEWVLAAREITYDIEDWVDLFTVRFDAAGIRRNPSSRFQGWFLCARKLTASLALHVISTELRSLKEPLNDLYKRHRDLMVMEEPPIERHRPRLDPCVSELLEETDRLVGLTGPVEEVTKMITENMAGLLTVSIVGMAGSGKTTLANQVYMRLRENCFQCQAFVSVGQKPDLKKTLMKMLSMLGNGHQVEERIKDLNGRIRETLEKKRYLIVVDDLWMLEHWETLKPCFPKNSLGSRIITATRNVQLAEAMATASDCIYNIGLLSEVDSKNLVLNRAFGNGLGCPQDLEDVFGQIITRCGGLPIALATVASMLTDHSSLGEWGKLAKSRWSLISHPQAETMKQILNLSYKDLPPNLKTCLLYLSIFPENYEVDVDRLARRWVAEGFIFRRHHTNKEELATISYLSELFGKNMVQPLHLNHEGWPRYCRLHPVIHDFLVCKSMEEKFATVFNVQDDHYFPNHNCIVRWLSLQSTGNQDQAMARNDYTDLSHARSISVFGQASSTPFLSDLKMARVLDFEGCVGPVCLDGLSTLLFLRYLSLRGTGVSELPETIGELRCLETLDVSSTKVKKLPPGIGALLHLRYFSIRDTDVSELPVTIGKLRYLETLDVRSTNVSELPTTIGDLRCLETLDARSTKVKELPHSIVKLKHTLKALLVSSEGTINLIETSTRMPEGIHNSLRLQKLGIIDLRGQHASYVKAIGGLNSLRVLKMTWSTQQSTQRAYREALVSSIEEWSQLESLTIHCGFFCSMEFLGSLSNPPRGLRKFKVTAARFAVIPQWIIGLERLSSMQITVCKLGSDDLSILRDLPGLKCLILGLESFPVQL